MNNNYIYDTVSMKNHYQVGITVSKLKRIGTNEISNMKLQYLST